MRRIIWSAAALASVCFIVLCISAYSGHKPYDEIARHPWFMLMIFAINSPSVLIAIQIAMKSAKPMAIVMITFMIVHATCSLLLTFKHDKGLIGMALFFTMPIFVPAILFAFGAVGLIVNRATSQIKGGFRHD